MKKANLKDYILWVLLTIIILGGTKYGDGEHFNGCQELGLVEVCNYNVVAGGIFFVVIEQF